MVNEGILEGLKIALSKGESLQQAMTSFYNAGYRRGEIEEAARALHKKFEDGQGDIEQESTKETKPKIKPKFIPKPQPVKEIKQPVKKEKPVQKLPPPRVSNYEEKTKKPKRKIIIILLIFFLLILMGILAGVFIFKDELIELFSRLM